eukprot:evm.model.scf_1679.4 EVM.evm.TU.scf_1679.4   scf_1679:14962-15273(-)
MTPERSSSSSCPCSTAMMPSWAPAEAAMGAKGPRLACGSRSGLVRATGKARGAVLAKCGRCGVDRRTAFNGLDKENKELRIGRAEQCGTMEPAVLWRDNRGRD